MVGSAVWRALEFKGYSNLIGKTINELDLRNQKAVDEFYNLEKPYPCLLPPWTKCLAKHIKEKNDKVNKFSVLICLIKAEEVFQKCVVKN